MKKIIYLIVMLSLMKGLLGDLRYTGNVHEYLMEESYELLKIDMQHEFTEMTNYMNNMKKGAKNEDKQDWIYGYSSSNPPNFNQTITNWLLNLLHAGSSFETITHFWGADGGDNNNTFLSGEMCCIPWSFSCENAVQKASEFLEGGEITPHYEFADIHFVESNQLAYAPHKIKIVDLQEFYQNGQCKRRI